MSDNNLFGKIRNAAPVEDLKKKAAARMAMLPPYQPVQPQELVIDKKSDGKNVTIYFRGMTKREEIASRVLTALIGKQGCPIAEHEQAHMARLSIMMSEALLQQIDKQQAIDAQNILDQMVATARMGNENQGGGFPMGDEDAQDKKPS